MATCCRRGERSGLPKPAFSAAIIIVMAGKPKPYRLARGMIAHNAREGAS